MPTPALDALSQKRRQFVLYYTGEAHGNATEAAKRAGYKNPRVIGARLLKVASVTAAIEEARKQDEGPKIMSRRERKEFFTRVAMGLGEEDTYTVDGALVEGPPKLKDRLRAAELLAKMEGDFLERVEHSGPGGTPVKIVFGDNGRGPAPGKGGK